MGIIRINCQEVYKSGIKLNNQLAELKQIVENMKKINENIKTAWTGPDSENFNKNFGDYLNGFITIEKQLENDQALLKSSALQHGTKDNELGEKMKKGMNDYGK